jgi:aminoglycoside phosphotransferase (APT) family kinase protein
MEKLTFNKTRIEKLIRRVFPESRIKEYAEFEEGLVNPTFKVEIIRPNKILAIKLVKLRRKASAVQNNKIFNYLNRNGIVAPKVLLEGVFDKKHITIMEFIEGLPASTLYKKSGVMIRSKILFNAGETLAKIHSLKIPPFWTHCEHEIRNKEEWRKWIDLRVKKYLNFFKNKSKIDFKFINQEMSNLNNLVSNEDIDFVPLHGDYHFSNINVNKKGEITGVFDFEGSLKGHSLAEVGQTMYWIRFMLDNSEGGDSFLKGYKDKFSTKDRQMIKGYTILHLLAISRSIWPKQNKLGWIIDKHIEILKDMKKR